MRKNYDVVIVGGGIQGLSLAYYLARDGLSRVAVFEKSYLGSGASSRNGQMIRSAFGSTEWIRLWDKSLRLWENLAHELNYNVMFTRHGYLVLATAPEQLELFRINSKRQQNFGLKTSLLDAQEIVKLIPAINPELVAGGNLQLNAGVARHDATIWAYTKAARNLNVDIFPFTEVVDIELKSGVVQGVRTSRGDVETRIVVNAAGAHDRRIAAMAGLDLPSQIYTNEIMVTEPIKPFLPIAVSVPGLRAYMHQSTRGEFVGGAERENKPPGNSMKSSLAGTRDIVRKYVRLYPGLAGVKLMRQWVGLISATEDHSPILGPVAGIEGFILSVGWGGYGFMGGPGGGKSLAEFILSGEVPPEIRPFNLERFKTGALVKETALLS